MTEGDASTARPALAYVESTAPLPPLAPLAPLPPSPTSSSPHRPLTCQPHTSGSSLVGRRIVGRELPRRTLHWSGRLCIARTFRHYPLTRRGVTANLLGARPLRLSAPTTPGKQCHAWALLLLADTAPRRISVALHVAVIAVPMSPAQVERHSTWLASPWRSTAPCKPASTYCSIAISILILQCGSIVLVSASLAPERAHRTGVLMVQLCLEHVGRM
nr:hypothetical protein CFP56_03877 [Quercus suber]